MTTTQKTPARKAEETDPMYKTAQEIEIATEGLGNARDQRVAAQRRLTNLLDTIDSGHSASGLVELREQVEVAERIEAAKARAVTKAKDERAAAVAEDTARHVSEALGVESPTLVNDAEAAALAALVNALGEIPAAIRKRDTTCDAAGERLNDAGVPIGTTVGRISYWPVTWGVGNRTISGQWNVSLEGVPYSQRDAVHYSARETVGLTEKALTEALRANGMRLEGRIEQAR